MDLTNDLEAIDADLLVHAGDADCYDANTTQTFFAWLNKVAEFFPEGAIFVPGNHDTYLRDEDLEELKEQLSPKVRILINESITVRGLKIWGSPCSLLASPKWNAFAAPYEATLADLYETIDADTDVLITHTPAYGTRDKGLGSVSLKLRVKTLEHLRLHICGHVHNQHGVDLAYGLTTVNASSVGTVDRGPFVPLVITILSKSIEVSTPDELTPDPFQEQSESRAQ